MLPILYQNPEFTLYSYPLLMGIGWGVAYQVFLHFFTNGERKAQILFWGSFVLAWLGAKLLYLLTSNHDLVSNVSFWTGGGFVFYGGFLGALTFLFIFHQFRPLKINELWPMLPALTVGHALGRIGCFLAGCCFGEETQLWWRVHLHGADRHPTQLLESLGLFLLTILVIRTRNRPAYSVATYLVGYGLLRLGVEALRGDMVRGTWGPLAPSQWLSLLLLLAGSRLLYTKKTAA